MSMRWRKVAGDMRRHGVQIGLVAIVLTLGAVAVVAAVDARAILKREIAASYDLSVSPDIAIWLDRVTPSAIAEATRDDAVAAAEARRVVISRVAARDGSWLPMRITVLQDIDSQQVARLHRHDASAPAAGLWIEQSGRSLVPRDELQVRTPTGSIVTVPISGFVHDTSVAPSMQDRII
jgi:putative ABC transport system permease protein